MKILRVEVRIFESKKQSDNGGLGKSIGFAKNTFELEKLLEKAREAPYFLVEVRGHGWWHSNFHLLEFREKVVS